MSRRILRINELLKRLLSQIIVREISADENLVTINEVITSADLRDAKVYVGIIGPSPDAKLLALNRQSSRFYRLLKPQLDLKYIPRLKFFIDNPEDSLPIENLLEKIKK